MAAAVGTRFLNSLKRRFSKKSSNSEDSPKKIGVLSNLKKTIQSTPDLFSFKDPHYRNLSFSSVVSPTLPTDQQSLGSISPGLSDSASSVSEISSLESNLPLFTREDKSNRITKPSSLYTRVLFSPPKSSPSLRPKLALNFSLKKSKSAMEFQSTNQAIPLPLPMITLTEPDDTESYCLIRPSPLLPCSESLELPTRSSQNKYYTKSQELSPKQWPHPSGPWLRPNRYESSFDPSLQEFVSGTRLSDGTIIGWDPDHLETIGLSMPPQLPTEQDLKTIALVEHISMSLDLAQNALYHHLDEEWALENEEEEFIIESLCDSGLGPENVFEKKHWFSQPAYGLTAIDVNE